MRYGPWFSVENVLYAKKAQRNGLEAAGLVVLHESVHWVGHPSGRLRLPKVGSLSGPPGPTATQALNVFWL